MTQANNCEKTGLSLSSLLFFDSLENFSECYKNIDVNTNPRERRQHLVYIQGTTLSEILKLQLDFNADNMDFLTRDANGSIVLVTGFMFSPSACKTNQNVVINRFNTTTMKWESSTFYPEKYENFHGCDLTIAEGEHVYGDLFVSFASALNFRQQIFEVKKAIQALSDTRVDLIHELGALSKDATDTRFKVVGSIIMTDEVKLVVPPGELYTPLEKMFIMFQYEVWVAIFVTIFIGLAVIQIINRCSLVIRNIVFGHGNNTPTLNMASTFLAGYQNRVPFSCFSSFGA